MKRAEKREHLIETAARVFGRAGYHGAGVDHVINEAGIAKTTLYRHFKSKDDLIVAVLQRLDKQFREDMRNFVDSRASDPPDKLLATFDYLEQWFGGETFHGCPFVSAAGEFGHPDSAVFRASVEHKQLMIDYFEELARAAKLRRPKQVANEINLLHEGATAVAHVGGSAKAARTAKAIASRLLA